jgi:hypothetical protein
LIIPIFVVRSIKARSFNGQGEPVSVAPWTDFVRELASGRHNWERGKCAATSVAFGHVLTVSSQITWKALPQLEATLITKFKVTGRFTGKKCLNYPADSTCAALVGKHRLQGYPLGSNTLEGLRAGPEWSSREEVWKDQLQENVGKKMCGQRVQRRSGTKEESKWLR